MELKDLQLGDRVQVVAMAGKDSYQPVGTVCQGEVIALDPKASRLQVMVGWREGEIALYHGKDNMNIGDAIYADNARTDFAHSYWMDVKAIICKITSAETTSVSVPVQVPALPPETPPSEPAFDFDKYNSTLPGRRHPYENDYH
jgi:hypothetical protein